jgi:Na+/proline symporter
MMNFTFSSLAAGFFFGIWGVYFLKRGRRVGHPPSLLIGLALIAYPYFIENDYLLWGIGAGLMFVGYQLAKSQ